MAENGLLYIDSICGSVRNIYLFKELAGTQIGLVMTLVIGSLFFVVVIQ